MKPTSIIALQRIVFMAKIDSLVASSEQAREGFLSTWVERLGGTWPDDSVRFGTECLGAPCQRDKVVTTVLSACRRSSWYCPSLFLKTTWIDFPPDITDMRLIATTSPLRLEVSSTVSGRNSFAETIVRPGSSSTG
jgi:hypothetical protein